MARRLLLDVIELTQAVVRDRNADEPEQVYTLAGESVKVATSLDRADVLLARLEEGAPPAGLAERLGGFLPVARLGQLLGFGTQRFLLG